MKNLLLDFVPISNKINSSKFFKELNTNDNKKSERLESDIDMTTSEPS